MAIIPKKLYKEIWGPTPILSTEGYRYYIVFTNTFTRFTWSYPMKLESEVLTKFIYVRTFIERQFEYKVKAV